MHISNINIIKRTFIRQSSADDCGLACMAMILNYTGRGKEIPFLKNVGVDTGGLSLLELKNIAASIGFPGRCVEMETSFLRDIQTPCILHVTNELGQNHFLVCYGSLKKGREVYYLIADPAIQVHHIIESELDLQWKSKAALYFDVLQSDLSAFRSSSLNFLINREFYPFGIWVAIPMLSLSIAAFGIALTWLLQKGVNDANILKGRVIASLLLLLFVISIFRSLFSFLRQYILIKVNLDTNRMLMFSFVNECLDKTTGYKFPTEKFVNDKLADIQKIQNAISAFLGVLIADGSLIMALMGGMFYLLPIAGTVTFIYLLFILVTVVKGMPNVIFGQGQIRELSSAVRRSLVRDRQMDDTNQKASSALKIHLNNLDIAKSMAVKISAQFMLYECIGTINLLIVFAFGLTELKTQTMNYPSFMLLVIEAFLISALMPKVLATLQQIAEGADAAIQLGQR